MKKQLKQTITVSEIFGPTLQGEGPLIGRPTLFVRTGGCDFRCSWCDSIHAVDERKHGDEWEETETQAVMDRLLDLSGGFPMLVTLSGGNPAMQPMGDLIRMGHELGYEFALETQGTVKPGEDHDAWFNDLDWLILSPKGPSSGMPFMTEKLFNCAQSSARHVALKFVVFDEADYEFARVVSSEFPLPVYLQAGTPVVGQYDLDADPMLVGEMKDEVLRSVVLERTRGLVERVARDHWTDVHVLPQLHVLLWGDKRGV